MAIKERRERAKIDSRRRILDAAIELFVNEGYHAVSMRRIAEKIEYSPTAIYLHFKNKSELLHCLCDEAFAVLLEQEAKVRETVTDPLEALRIAMRGYVEFGIQHPGYYRIALMMDDAPEDPQPFAGSTGEKAYLAFRNAVEVCISAGIFKPLDVDLATQMLWSAMHGLTSLLILNNWDFPWADKNALISHTIETVLQGLRK
jgi:AcrR family transcriptional regulator